MDSVYVGRGGITSLADPDSASLRMRRRRAYTLILLTQVAPGTAQLVGGNRKVGRAALRLALTVLGAVAVVAVLFLVNRAFVLNLFARPVVLWGLAAALLAAGVGWLLLFVDAWRLARTRTLPGAARTGVTLLTAVCMVFTGSVSLWAANVMRVSAQTVSQVFGGDTVMSPSQGRYNILLLGGDSGEDRVGLRPDTIMLASVDASTGGTVLYGFTRDTENVHFRPGSTMARLMPEGWDCGDQCLLNGLYTWAHENQDRFPKNSGDVGVLATKEAVEWLSGLDIQYYAMVDLRGFQRFIDAVGGIQIDVKEPVAIGGGTSPIKGYIQPGVQYLDGYHALWYARSRVGGSNYDRMARQQDVLSAMLEQLHPQTVITKYQEIAPVAGSVLQTDIPAADIGTLSDLALKARSGQLERINFTPPLIEPWNYDVQQVRDKVRTSIAESEATNTETGGEQGGEADNGAKSGAQ